jgi:outer membrane lipoprotein-sorting protein
MRKAALSLAILVLFSPFASAQDPLELLKKVAATYAALPKTTYDFEQVEVREYLDGMRNKTEQRQRIAGAGGKYRQEMLSSSILYLFDGQFQWVYNRDRNEYTKAIVNYTAGHAPGLSMFEIAGYRAKSARLLRQETLELASGPVVCQVIEVARESPDDRMQYSPITYWIDASRNLALKMNYRITVKDAGRPSPTESVITVSFPKATVGQSVEESLFRFTPPADAVQVERLSFGPKSPLVGKDTPDFELKGAGGQAITGVSLRGSMVLLQFSERPEDDTLPFLEMTYRALNGKGLTAFYVLRDRRLDTGSHAYTVPVAIDSNGSAAKQFGIGHTGTVLIDRLGKVVYADTSSQSWLELARALQKAEVW